MQGLTVTFGQAVNFSGAIYIATGGATLFPGKAFTATVSDRLTADDRNPDGTANDEALRATLTFTNGKVDAFLLSIDTLEVKLGSYVTLTARDFTLNTGAAADASMVHFGAVGAKVRIGSLDLGGEARNFDFLGDGSFKANKNFGVYLSIGSATGDSFKWPAFLPVQITALGVEWADVENHPEEFVLVLSASVTEIKGMKGMTFSGSVQGIRIAPYLLARGEFPIIGVDSIGVSVTGKAFGGEINGQLIGGILKLDNAYAPIGIFDNTTVVAHRVFYLGIAGGFSFGGMSGFQIRLGLSELGPLQVFISVSTPTGLLLEPNSGLTLNDFAAGVEFFKSLPSIDDPFALRSSAFGLPTTMTVDDWLASLQGQVALQVKTLSEHPEQSGFLAAFTAPMTITGSAKIYSAWTSQAIFNGVVTIKLSTDGKFLISGTLNFANNNLSITGRLYADLSQVTAGKVTILFLADIPDQVRVLSLYGKIKMGFRDSTGQEVVFAVPDDAPSSGGSTAPTASVASPTDAGGTVDVNTLNNQLLDVSGKRYVDVLYTPAPGATINWLKLLKRTTSPFTLFVGGTGTSNGTDRTTSVTGRPTLMVTVTTASGATVVPLQYDPAAGGSVYYMDGTTKVVVVKAADLLALDKDSATDEDTLLAAAMRITGSTRVRYLIGTDEVPVGVVRLVFEAGAFENAATGAGAGLGNAASTLTFSVTGATPSVTDPGQGGAIDVNVLNGRGWIDVTFKVPAGRTIDLASLFDSAPEFTLSGAGLGSIVLDPSKAPTCLANPCVATSDVTLRYWLLGNFASKAGTVQLTYLPGAWSFVGNPDLVSLTFTIKTDKNDGGLLLTFKTASGQTLDPDSVTDLLDEFVDLDTDVLMPGTQIYKDGDWVVTLDATAPVLRIGTTNQYSVPVTIVRAKNSTFTGDSTLSITLQVKNGTVRLRLRRHRVDDPRGDVRRPDRRRHGAQHRADLHRRDLHAGPRPCARHHRRRRVPVRRTRGRGVRQRQPRRALDRREHLPLPAHAELPARCGDLDLHVRELRRGLAARTACRVDRRPDVHRVRSHRRPRAARRRRRRQRDPHRRQRDHAGPGLDQRPPLPRDPLLPDQRREHRPGLDQRRRARAPRPRRHRDRPRRPGPGRQHRRLPLQLHRRPRRRRLHADHRRRHLPRQQRHRQPGRDRDLHGRRHQQRHLQPGQRLHPEPRGPQQPRLGRHHLHRAAAASVLDRQGRVHDHQQHR